MKNILKATVLFTIVFLLASCENKNATDFINEGIAFTEEQKYDEAILSFKEAIKLEPNNPLAHYTLGGMYTFKNMHERAIKEYTKAMELDNTYPDPHYSLGFVFQKMGRLRDAESEFAIFEKLKNKKNKMVP